MKTKYLVTFLFCVFLMVPNSQAQFLKKLKKRAENAVERTILNKTDQEVSEKTEEVIDKTVSGENSEGNNQESNESSTSENEQSPSDKESPSEEERKAKEEKMSRMFGGGLEGVPDTYAFSYILTYQIETNKESIPFQYFLEPNAPYFANKMEDKGTTNFMVYDLKKNFMVMYMDDGKQKMAMKMKMANMKKVQKKYGDRLFSEDENKKIQITPIEGRTILGYNCLGFKVVSDDGEGKFWMTNEAPVSLNQVFTNFKKMPEKGPYANIPMNEKTLILEMEFQSSKKKKDNMHMICTDLSEKSFTINKKDYKAGM